MFATVAFVYFVAVVQRTALGVAGVEALDRFGVEALGLASLSVVQISIYAALQIPAGALLDRVGPKAMLAVGSLVMASGQLLLAHADSLWLALAARVLIGAGDAPIFISATRLASEWFPPRQAPVMVQVTGLLGQAGQLASAVPVAWLLHASGWTVTFSVLAGLGVAAAIMAVLRVRMPHHGELHYATAAPHHGAAKISIREALRPPGVRLAFWTHWTGMFFANTIAMLWGVPFLIQGQGLTPAQASVLLSVLVIANMATGPLMGALTARHPLRRSWIILGSAAVTATAWASVLIPATPRPMIHLILWAALLGAGGPASLVGMDFARTFGRPGRLGTATGFANIGGFAATVLSVALVGATLQIVAPGTSEYTLDNYRIALATMGIPWAIGVAGILHSRRRTRAIMAADGIHVPPIRDAIARHRRSSPRS
ncbi:MFS transporter [Demequina sp. B12]|uniref:MFS transporter n=1 Tax=Demequina sp. B12 TaxID=2992757 RepID=UPI00237ACE20|nr:MFS transporter [Demequina sp. B12]MDE0571895.1 MFS transporter [Demequina sp. B12]